MGPPVRRGAWLHICWMAVIVMATSASGRKVGGADKLRWHQLHNKLDKSLERVRLVLEQEKSPQLAEEVHHRYEDKFFLAESLTSSALASQLNHFAMLGLDHVMLERLHGWATETNKATPVLLRMQAQEQCHFVRNVTKGVEDKRQEVTEVTSNGVPTKALAKKVVTTVNEFIWQADFAYQISALQGVLGTSELIIQARNGSTEFSTMSEGNPCDKSKRRQSWTEDVDIRWLLRTFSLGTSSPVFNINRTDERCLTPYRNPEIDQARDFFDKYSAWAQIVHPRLRAVMRIDSKFDEKAAELDDASSASLFVPVMPILQDEVRADGDEKSFPAGDQRLAGVANRRPHNGTALLSDVELTKLLAEEFRSLKAKQERIQSIMSDPSAGNRGVATSADGVIVMTLMHSVRVMKQCLDALEYIEEMMERQLVSALGQEITAGDFAEYMAFHSRTLFSDDYSPKPFSYAVRRSVHHSPEGTVNIQKASNSAPIETLVAREASPDAMFMALSASSFVAIHGDRYLHGWLAHDFSRHLQESLSLSVKANQFSSFIVVVGQITSSTTFDAKYAAIVQNKDELTIPLELSTIPTPKEFKDAIESLSPKQQAFARAFRAMQLESTLFGILVIQIKPQLEKVLNLPADSLTKNIKLTQDLMQLFIKYQIPTDLLSFDDAANASISSADRISTVGGHVSAMMAMIKEAKDEEVDNRKQEECYKHGGSHCGSEQPIPSKTRKSSSTSQTSSTGYESRLRSEPEFASVESVVQESAVWEMPHLASLAEEMVFFTDSGSDGGTKSKGSKKLRVKNEMKAGTPASRSDDSGGTERPEAQEGNAGGGSIHSRDYTQVPKDMDQQFERLDVDAVLRPTIIKAGSSWMKKSQAALLADATTSSYKKGEQEQVKDSAFHLLDALTKSGALPIDDASLHIVVAATHRFDKDIIETVVQDNINPIEKAERSLLIMASTVHEKPASTLIGPSQQERVKAASPILFGEGDLPSAAVL